MKYLVLGATGTVGSHVTRELLARNQQVRALTRDPKKAEGLGPNVEVVKGDLTDMTTLATMCDGVDGMFLVNGLSLEEASEGLFAALAAKLGKVKRLVYLSVHHAEQASYLPHFGGKLGVEAGVRASGTAWTILRPNNFYQNDQWFKDAILQYGVYPQPLGGVGVSRVDVRDIAEAAAIALLQDGHAGKTYDLVGPRPWTGEETAQLWSQTVGKPVRYAGDDLEAWAQQQLQWLPAWLVHDFRHMYAYFQQNGFKATAEEVAALTKLLGHPPRGYEAYVAETSAAWTGQGAPTR